MGDQENENLELTSLEARVDELIRTVENLASENRALKSQHATLASERALLIEKTEMARTRVEAMIARLKAMEAREGGPGHVRQRHRLGAQLVREPDHLDGVAALELGQGPLGQVAVWSDVV